MTEPWSDEPRITKDLLDEPHIEGRRIPVLTIHEKVEGRGLDPAAVADTFNLSVADVHRALAFYHDHPELFEQIRQERDEMMNELEEEIKRPEFVNPPN